ncbi:MAG: V-type ATPase subunit [Pyrobaculum sp.]
MTFVAKRPSLGPRVRGLRIKELPRDKLIAIAYANTLDELLNTLKTAYGITLDRLTKENIGELRGELIKIYLDKIRSIYLGSDKDAKEVVLSSLKFFEYENIRNIAIAIRAGKSPDDFVFWAPLEFTRRRHIVASLLGVKNLEDMRERLRQLKHPAHRAFELAARYGEDKLSIFVDRQWIEDFSKATIAKKDRSFQMFTEDLKEYFNVLITLRSRLWGLSEEVGELVVGKPTPMVTSAAKDPPARFLENATSVPWGRVLVDIVAEMPTLENIAIAMDNIYPAYVRKLADTYMVKFSEFSLGALAARLEYMRAEVMAIIRAASLIAEGVSLEKRRKIFEALARA